MQQKSSFSKFIFVLLFCSLISIKVFGTDKGLGVEKRLGAEHSQYSQSQYIATAENAMVVTDHVLATEVGVNTLKQGGNAVDAAIAIAYALAVVEPCCGNLGGGGFMLLHKAEGTDLFLNFREKAPNAATEKMYIDKNGKVDLKKSTEGYLAVAIPGTVLGLETAREKYGTMSRSKLMQPAIRLAEKGFILSVGDIKLLQEKHAPTDYQAYKASDKFTQKDLATSLKLIEKEGAQAFYEGRLAQKIVNASLENGGILSLQDFSQYNVEEREPLSCTYHDLHIVSVSPPSSGGIALCEMLNILEHYPLSHWEFRDTKSTHYIVEAMRLAFRDRSNLGDPNFVENPVACLISKKYADLLVANINPNQATPSKDLSSMVDSEAYKEGCNTTHFVVRDKAGNIVALTYTLNSLYGAKVIAEDTGFFLNNEMDDFTTKSKDKNQFGLVQGNKNKIEPGKRPLSSMSPTLVYKNNKPYLVLGAAGGPKIITANLLTMLQIVDFKIPLYEAVNSPRFHHQYLPDEIEYEIGAFSNSVQTQLQNMGYSFVKDNGFFGVENLLYIDPETGKLTGVSDKRREASAALGY